ncbi:MAG TPA: DUF4412 domain-containing protein [Cyclobacteriaceae bacterium]
MKTQMEETKKKMNDPATQAQMKQMQERMNDPQMKAMMEQNPQMKQQMEAAMKMMQGGDMNSMMPTGITIKIKDGNTLTHMEGGMMGGSETLYKKDKHETFLINATSKTYSKVSGGNNSAPQNNTQVKVTKTTETQKILNYTCTKSIVTTTHDGKEINQYIWTTKEIKDFDLKSLARQQVGKGQSMFYENIEGVPLKMEMITPQMKMEMTVTEIKKGSLPASTFEIPAGYTETQIPGMH